jgi:hypothetical protein
MVSAMDNSNTPQAVIYLCEFLHMSCSASPYLRMLLACIRYFPFNKRPRPSYMVRRELGRISENLSSAFLCAINTIV